MAKLFANKSSPIGVPTLRGLRIVENDRTARSGIAGRTIPWAKCSQPKDGVVHIDQCGDDSLPRSVVIINSKSKRIAYHAWRRATIRAFQNGRKIHRSFKPIRWFHYIGPLILAIAAITGVLLAIRFAPSAFITVYQTIVPEYRHTAIAAGILTCAVAIFITGAYFYMAFSLWPRSRPTEIVFGIDGIDAIFADGTNTSIPWERTRSIKYSHQIRVTSDCGQVLRFPNSFLVLREVKLLYSIHLKRQGRLNSAIRRELVRSIVFAITVPVVATLFLTWAQPPDFLRERPAVLLVLGLVILFLTSMPTFSLALPWIDKRYGRKIRGWWRQPSRMKRRK